MRTSSVWLQMPSTQEPYQGADQAALLSHSKEGPTKFHKDVRFQRTELEFWARRCDQPKPPSAMSRGKSLENERRYVKVSKLWAGP